MENVQNTINLKEIVDGTEAVFSHCCHGICCYTVTTKSATYQFEIDSSTDEWKTTYLLPTFKAITLMRWIRLAIENNTLVRIK